MPPSSKAEHKGGKPRVNSRARSSSEGLAQGKEGSMLRLAHDLIRGKTGNFLEKSRISKQNRPVRQIYKTPALLLQNYVNLKLCAF